MKIAFLGTPDFAIPSLKMLIESGHDIVVFTQMDKPVGRRGVLTAPPVKVLALENGLQVYQFNKIRADEGIEALRNFAPELMVTVAFGQILSKENLAIPKHGCINVHGSLLPKYRGAAPIQWAIINGEQITGITTMLTDIGLDTGDMLLKSETEIGINETAGDLFERLAVMGADVLRETIAAHSAGVLVPQKQNEDEASKCSMIKKEHARINFNMASQQIHNLVRGMNPWPVAHALCDGRPIKIWETRLSDIKCNDEAGTVAIAEARRGLFVNTGEGVLEICEAQFQGGKRVSAKDLLNGTRMERFS